MRVVYDTSVLAKILARRGELLKLKQNVLSGKVTLISSEYILNELEAVLSSKFGLTKQKAKIRMQLLARIAEVVFPTNVERVARDPADDYILAAALTGRAKCIVTLDKDLLVLKQHKGIVTITPSEFNQLRP